MSYICKVCGAEISRVIVTSPVEQIASIDDEGSITEYGKIKSFGVTRDITCPACGNSIKEFIVE